MQPYVPRASQAGRGAVGKELYAAICSHIGWSQCPREGTVCDYTSIWPYKPVVAL